MKDAKQRYYQREIYHCNNLLCRITWRCENKKEEGEKTILIIPIATRY
jgi:hypothetical protein